MTTAKVVNKPKAIKYDIDENDFRPLPNYQGYEFNCMGQVKSPKGKILKPNKSGKVRVSVSGKKVYTSVSQELIQHTFIPGHKKDAQRQAEGSIGRDEPKADQSPGPKGEPTTKPTSAAPKGESKPKPGRPKDPGKVRGGLGPVTDAEIRQMRKMLKDGYRNKDIVEKFKVDSAIPSDLRAGRIYKNRGLL